MKSKKSKRIKRKGKVFSIYGQIIQDRNIKAAWEKVKTNKGAAGIDRETIENFQKQEEIKIREIQRLMQQKRYQPKSVKRVMIPKPNGDQRPLGIPTIRDRVVQQAILNKIENIYEKHFHQESYGFRPNRSTHQAIDQVINLVEKENYNYVVEIDIKAFFDNVNHQKLMVLLNEHIADGTVLNLIESFLKAPIKENNQKPRIPRKGTPQGGVLSPLLANVYLNYFDRWMKEKNKTWIRYADDILIFAKSKKEAEENKKLATEILKRINLEVNKEKTKVRSKEEGFQFLGYHFLYVTKKNGEKKLLRKIRDKSKKKFKANMKKLTRRQQPVNIEKLIKERLNPVIRGFGNYFNKVNIHSYMNNIDGWIRMRLRAFLRKKKSKLDNYRYTNKFFEELGLISLESLRKICSQ